MPISQTTYTSLITAKNLSWVGNSYDLATATLGSTFGNYVVNFIESLSGYPASDVVMATSICADDISALSASGNIGQYPRELMQFLGPFSSSGLAGYPHYGVTGVFAWASHATDTGALFLLVTPHIGVTQYGDTGLVYRRGQVAPSSTCGAVAAAVNTVISTVSLVTSIYGSWELQGESWTPINGNPGTLEFDNFSNFWILYVNEATFINTTQLSVTGDYVDTNTYDVVTLSYPTLPTLPTSGSELFAQDFQQWLLTNELFPARDTLLSSTTAGRMLIATKTIIDSASAAITNVILPPAYAAFFPANSQVPVFTCFGTFVNVDDGYEAYIAPISFMRYDSTGWIDYTDQFIGGI